MSFSVLCGIFSVYLTVRRHRGRLDGTLTGEGDGRGRRCSSGGGACPAVGLGWLAAGEGCA